MKLEELLRKLSRQTIRIGSSAACEICFDDASLPAVAAEIVHHGGGRLSLVPSSTAQCFAGQQLLSAKVPVNFDFNVQYQVGTHTIPNSHPDLCLMMMGRGYLPPAIKQLIVGRDPQRCHLVMNSQGVSGCHATFDFGTALSVVDQGSKSGTWYQGTKLTPHQAYDLPESAVIALGPLPLTAYLVREIHEALLQDKAERTATRTEAMPRATAELDAQSTRIPAPPQIKNKTVMGTVKMTQAATFTVGRVPENDIVLDYAQVSGHHAKLIQLNQQLYLEDAGSELGTQVRGSRLKAGQRAQLSDGDNVLFGPIATTVRLSEGGTVQLLVEDQKGWAGRPLFDVAAANITIEVPDRNDTKKRRRLLDSVNFRAQPGDMVALMGPSGSGKTTLLHALTGYLRPSSGEVLINGTPLPQVFEQLRGSIGYVPQDDIIHPELTVYEAVNYSARFRLPHDYSDQEIDRRVRTTLAQLGLEAVAHLQIGRPELKILSGGQRKRVNIAMELVTDPVLLFLDEPTSGLAADDTTSLIDLLAALARDYGKTIVATIHQPARDEYEKFNLALILGHGGIPIYFGPTRAAYSFFEAWRGPYLKQGVHTPRDMFAELKEREARFEKEMPQQTAQELREAVAKSYAQEYLQSSTYQDVIHSGRGAEAVQLGRSALPGRAATHGQLRLLINRYFKIKLRDRVGTAILLLQAPIIGLLLSAVFGGQKPAIPYWCLGALNELAHRSGGAVDGANATLSSLEKTTDHAGAVFFLIISAVWFGTSNAARDIVSERAIFRRERMVNLQIGRYVMSKFIVLSALSAIQCTILLGIVAAALGLAGGLLALGVSLGMMILTAVCSVALGLLLSAVVVSSEAAMALTPIALIPQVVLGGLMVPVTSNPWLKWPMQFVPARWGFEGVIRPERLVMSADPHWQIKLAGAPDSVSDYIQNGHFMCALAQLESSQFSGAWGFSSPPLLPAILLSAMTIGLLGLVIATLSRED